MAEQISITAQPIKCVFKNEDTDFYIYGMELNNKDKEKIELNRFDNFSLTSDIELDLYKELDMTVEAIPNARYEASYKLIAIKYGLPKTAFEQAQYIKAIVTSKQFEAIYDVYSMHQDNVATMIYNDELDVTNVKRIGETTIAHIKNKLVERLDMNELITFLNPYDVSMNLITKIHKHYYSDSKKAIAEIKKSPYNLLQVRGIGFLRADAIAMEFGIDPTSEERILNGLFYVIHDQVFQVGDTYTTYEWIIRKLASLLDIQRKVIKEVFTKENLAKYNVAYMDNGKITTTAMMKAENFIAQCILSSSNSKRLLMPEEDVAEFIEYFNEHNNFQLSDEQEGFLYSVNKNQINFLVGYGGSGKSATVAVICQMLDWYKEEKYKFCSVELCAPTGRASKILTEYVGKEAQTIHRFAKIMSEDDDGSAGEFDRPQMSDDYSTYINGLDLIIIDETSMVDIPLMYKLLSVLNTSKTKILFVGDDYQLPSVGAGNFLYDCLNADSDGINITKLTKVFRIKEGGLVEIAKAIRDERQFLSYSDKGRIVFGKDLVFNLIDDKQEILNEVLSAYNKILKRPDTTIDDIMVVTPKRKNDLGTVNLNNEIQAMVNPLDFDGREMRIGKDENEISFRVGDKVINEVNSYELPLTNNNFDVTFETKTVEGALQEETERELETCDIFNGELGIITAINNTGTKMVVKYDESRVVLYDEAEARKSLKLGYVSTVHKSQGGQFKYVICVLNRSDIYQLNANLIYTAITRTQKACLVLSQSKTMITSLKKFINVARNTRLIDILSGREKIEYTDDER